MSWLDELERELQGVGVPSGRRRRIVAELADHLAEDPAAAARLGEPGVLARRFRDELGTAFARRAGFAVFVALAPVGVLSGVLALVSAGVVNLGTVLGVQLAFVGGVLAVLRARRLGGVGIVPAAEAAVLRRRVLLGVGGGALTLASIGIATQRPLALVTIAVGTITLAGAAAASLLAARLRPLAGGEPRDLSFDLGVDADPWRLALRIAGAVAVCIALAGIVQSDPLDGLVRAAGDGLLCLAGFAALGRPLGLRS